MVCDTAELGIDVVAGLDERADQSLLRRMPDFDEPRLLMLQVMREYAAERLQERGDGDATRARHAAAFQALAEEAAPLLFGPDRKKWLDRLEVGHHNFPATVRWALVQSNPRRAMGLPPGFLGLLA